jgi:hypothetical protein
LQEPKRPKYIFHDTEIEMPNTVKSPPENALRKKIFSNSKLLNNENISEVNNCPVSPTSPLGESSRAYDQLKNKITTLEGRLV